MTPTASPGPWDGPTERQVLCDALHDRDIATGCIEEFALSADHFYVPANRALWAMLTHRIGDPDAGPLDQHVVRHMLAETPALAHGCTVDEVTQQLAELLQMVPTGGNASHVNTLVGLYRRRLVVGASYATIAEAENLTAPVDELVPRATDRLAGSDIRPLVSVGSTMREALREGIDEWNRLPTDQARRFIPTQIDPLDRLIGGLEAGRLITVAGRPGMGKIVLGMAFSRTVVATTLRHVLHYSLEMPKTELAARYAAATGAATLGGLTGKDPRAHASIDWTALLALEDEDAAERLRIVEKRDAPTVTHIVASARQRHRATGQLGLVVVDYIGLLLPSDNRITNRVHQIGQIVTALKDLAMELDIPVVALAQLNRSVEKRIVKAPELSDLRESGDIEQTSDQVVLVNRPDYYDGQDRPGEADLIVAKNRAGSTGTATVAFDGPHVRFLPLTRQQPAQGSAGYYSNVPLPEGA